MAFGDMSCFAPNMYLALLTLEETLFLEATVWREAVVTAVIRL